MNQDMGELIKRIRIENPVVVGGVVSLVLFLILSGVTVPGFVRNRQERNALREEYETAQSRLEQIRALQDAQPEQFAQRLVERQAELAALLEGFPSKDEVSAEMAKYYRYASDVGAQLVRLEALLSPPKEIDQPGYDVQRFIIEARGEVPEILRFFSSVGSGPYVTFLLDNINVLPNGPAVGESDLTIYSKDLPAGELALPQPEAAGEETPTGLPGASSEVLQLETLMRRAMVQEDWAAAIAHGRHILELEPGRENVIAMLYESRVSWGRELAAGGQDAQAREQYEEALRLVPNGQDALDGLRALGDQGSGTMPALRLGSPPLIPSQQWAYVRRMAHVRGRG